MSSTRGNRPAHRATDRRGTGRVLVRHLLLVSAGAAVAACGDSPTTPRENAPAYDPYAFAIDESGAQHRYLYHWPAGRTIRVYVDPTAEPAGSDLRSAVVSAASLWGGTVRNGEVAVAIASAPGQADVIVHYGEAPRLVGPGDCAPPASGGSGSTFLCPDFTTGTLVVLPLLAGGGRQRQDGRRRLPERGRRRRAVPPRRGARAGTRARHRRAQRVVLRSHVRRSSRPGAFPRRRADAPLRPPAPGGPRAVAVAARGRPPGTGEMRIALPLAVPS